MGSLLLVLLLLLLSPSYPRGGSARRRRGARTQSPGGSSHPQFWVRLSPDFKAVPLGGSVWLNCSSSCPLSEGSSLRTELRRGETLSGPRWVSYQLLDVRAWNSDVHCFAKSRNQGGRGWPIIQGALRAAGAEHGRVHLGVGAVRGEGAAEQALHAAVFA